jgi:hypothetical protein
VISKLKCHRVFSINMIVVVVLFVVILIFLCHYLQTYFCFVWDSISCFQCGDENGGKFCGSCGTKLILAAPVADTIIETPSTQDSLPRALDEKQEEKPVLQSDFTKTKKLKISRQIGRISDSSSSSLSSSSYSSSSSS